MQPWDEFEWDGDNEDKLADRHGVDRVGNPEYIFVGKTDYGRILFMAGVRKAERRWRIGSAREAEFREKRAYRKRNG